MTDDRKSVREDEALDALIIAAMLRDSGDGREIDLAADAAELSQADRAQLKSLPSDFVERIVRGGWVCQAPKSDDAADGDATVLSRVTR